MNNLPFGQNNTMNQNGMQSNLGFGGGFTQQYNPPPPTLTFALVEGRQSVDNFLVSTNVTAFLCDFTNMKLYVKERDANNILKPTRTFSMSEESEPQIANSQADERFVAMKNEMDELKQMFQTFMSSQQNNNQRNSNNKGGNK